MNSKFQAKNIRPHDKLVHLDPPQIHFSAYVTGGLKKLFTKINSHDASVLPLYEYGRFTDINGHFVPEKNSLLASRYRVLGKVSARTHGQSSVQIFAKDEFNSDSLVVIKVLHKTWGHLAYQEIHFLWSLNVADPHKASRVVQLLNIFELDDHFCLVFEPLVPAPLTRVFQGFNRDQLIPNIKKVTLRVLTTLGFLQQQNVIHADLKPENILLKSESDVGSVTVIDFGNAIHNKFKEVALYFKDFELQTLLYRAPEVLLGLPFGTEIDLWSLGCILAELYSGMPLFPGTSKIPVIKEMTRLLGPFPRSVFQKGKFYDDLKGYTDACEQKNASEVLFKKLGCRDYLFRDFLSGLLRYDPADRLTPLQAAQHPFLASELPVAFLMPSEQNQKVIKPSSQEPPVNSTLLEIDQLKPDLLQKVKLIKPLQKDTVKIEENLGDFQRPTKRVKESPGMARRYHSMSDVKDHKSNSDTKIQRQVKISPFHVSNDRKISLLFSPKQTGNGMEQFDNMMTSTENLRQRNSRSLGKVGEDGNASGHRDNSRERISNDERHLQSLMREIHEVQEMVEDNMDQGSADSADSFEMKRRRFSDSQFPTVTQDRNNPMRAVGLFVSYDLLKVIPVVQFLFLIKFWSSLPLLVLQKPFSSGKRLSNNQFFRIFRHAVIGAFIGLLWLFGLTLCGPLRTILLFEHSDLVIIAGASALFTNNGGGPAKTRGAIFFLVAVITLLLFDHDEKLDHLGDHEPKDKHHTIFSHLFYHTVNFIGWSDHKGGVVLLAITLCMQVGYNSASRKLSVDVGGAKKLHALSSLAQATVLFPWATFIYFTKESEVESWLYLVIPMGLVILFVFLLDFYIEAVASNHLQGPRTAVYGTYAIFISALLLGVTWNHPMVSWITTVTKDIITEDHVLSGGVIFSLMTFILATSMLGWPGRSSKAGSFIGYSPSGQPLYSFNTDAFARTSHSIATVMKNGLRQILEESDSRKIFYFLCINLMFTFVELVYGVWTNSLGLISDGFHMLFDCSALVMGLYAAVMSRWKPTRIFSYGYDRVEVLSGFINGLFLIVIGIFVFTEALGRLVEPPEVSTERLLTVSVLGLLVNLFGIVAFRSSHSHGHGGHGHSHGGGHGHSHGGGHNHGHSHGGEGHQDRNANMEGVFLHVLADTLGSVGVIISSLLIENFGWNIADPICSLFIATMILLSVFPLLKETSTILLLRTPSDLEAEIPDILQKIMSLDGVLTYRHPHIWNHTSSKIHGTLHVQVSTEVSEQKIVAQVTNILKEHSVSNLVVQVEKETYFYHLSGLGASFDQMTDFGTKLEQFTVESIKAI